MNRKERRAAIKRIKTPAVAQHWRSPSSGIEQQMEEAARHFSLGDRTQAEAICRQILDRDRSNVRCLNLLGMIAQESGRQNLAVRCFSKAIAASNGDPAVHYNIASSYQVLKQREQATFHFKKAIALGSIEMDFERLISQNRAVFDCLRRLEEKWPLPVPDEELLEPAVLQAIAEDIFLRCVMETVVISGMALEALLTRVRAVLLRIAGETVRKGCSVDENVISLACALARQCFINEYTFGRTDDEMLLVSEMRKHVGAQLTEGKEAPSIVVAATAAYLPLHSLANAEALLRPEWPESVSGLLRQQVEEPMEEARNKTAIPAPIPVEDAVSLRLMRQYDENPYPRWTIAPATPELGSRNASTTAAENADSGSAMEILIAGCGTGQHALQVAHRFPHARILAIDISLSALAYACRKTREAGIRNIEYAQCDVLALGGLGRAFDRIESVGVLHHLADPNAGWRVLLSALRAGGKMRIGLYSEAARQSIADARAFIAERGYRATSEDIRHFRQEILHSGYDRRWRKIVASADFYSMSGCRDLLFNVVEHRFTIPRIAAFLEAHKLVFLGFEIDAGVTDAFQEQFPQAGTLRNLNCWHEFETATPETFWNMYVFSICRDERPP